MPQTGCRCSQRYPIFAPPQAEEENTPFQAQLHTPRAILCGDFNLAPHTPEYTAIQEPFSLPALTDSAQAAINNITDRWQAAWQLVHGQVAHAPTFRLCDHSYGPEPMACDFVFVSDAP